MGILSRVYPPARCPQYYDPHHLGPDDASLVPYRFRSGMLNSAKSFAFKYGYVEARVRMPKGFALWPALWLRDWKAWSYELDALEGFDRDARTFRGTYWWGNGANVSTSADGATSVSTPTARRVAATRRCPRPRPPRPSARSRRASDLSAGYHTVGLNWTPTRYELYLDGVKRWTSPAGTNVASDYNHLILNLAFGNDTDEFDWNRAPVRPLDAGRPRRRVVPEADRGVGLRAGVAAGRPPRRLHDRHLLRSATLAQRAARAQQRDDVGERSHPGDVELGVVVVRVDEHRA